MIQITSKEDIYPAVEELVSILDSQPASGLSTLLRHRMHAVSWTTRDELLGEIAKVLTDALNHYILREEVKLQIIRIIEVIGENGDANQHP